MRNIKKYNEDLTKEERRVGRLMDAAGRTPQQQLKRLEKRIAQAS